MKSEEFDVFKLFYLLKKNAILLIISFLLLSISVFSYLSLVKAENYKASFTVYSTTIGPNVLVYNIASFQDLIDSKNYALLSKFLNISIEGAESLSFIEAKELKNKEEKNLISIMALGKDSLVLSGLRQNLKAYFSNNQVFVRSYNSVKENLLYSKQKINQELDSANLSYKTDKILLINNNTDLPDLLNKKQEIELDLVNFALFENVGSPLISKPEKSILSNAIISLLSSFVIAILVVWFLEFLKFINARLKYYEGHEN